MTPHPCLKPSLALAFLAAIACALDARTADRGLDLYWCDVEGGAATLIVTPAGESLLVDSGWPGERDAERIVALARRARIERIDHYLTSHWHRDHFGGLAALAARIPIRAYYDHGFPALPQRDIPDDLAAAYRTATGGKSTVLRPGDTIALRQTSGTPKLLLRLVASGGVVSGESAGAPAIRACPAGVAHEAKPIDESDNARSLAFLLAFGDWSFFDAGDLTWNVEHKLVCPRNLVGRATVYQVTHHGMDTSNNPVLVSALAPRVAIMNNGARKGGAAPVVRMLRGLTGLEGFFALHLNVQTSAEENAAREMTANDSERCSGEHVALSVAADARSYTVSLPSKGTTRTFQTPAKR